MAFTSQTHLLLLYLMYYSGNMFRLTIESSSGPYIKIQILNLLQICYGIPNTTCFVLVYIMFFNATFLLRW
jgi:hypothetical protein